MNRYLIARRGITLAETVISTLLIGFVLVSTLQIIGPMVRSNVVHANRLVAANLANELSEEIATKRFTDPDVDSGDALGVDAGESSATRATFDDVDDYNGWTSMPPKLSTNQSNVSLNGWKRSVTVKHVLLSNVNTSSPTRTGVKKIVVIVKKDGVELARVKSFHTQAADTLGFVIP